MTYARFAGLVVVAALLMGAMIYLNAASLDHVTFTQGRLWLALLAGSILAGVAMTWLFGRYRDKATNMAVIVGAIVLAAGIFWLIPA